MIRHPNDKNPHDAACESALNKIDAHAGQGVDAFYAMAFRDGWQAHGAAGASEGQAEPVAWRHNRTFCLYETEEEVPLADGDEWAEPLYLHPSAEIAALRERIAGMEKDLESRIPDGWRFYTADFSGSRSPGSATLIRDDKGKAEWLALSDEEREATDLYVFGRGNTFREAIDAAIAAIAKEKQA
ncbi:hypothetical protein [Caballeronia sp. ATUFL_M1_KS5A]|uniref:hypothetical protein n=1 Tax=Caballeronia sp. ATUFL_M1_KS5A TaxID=2921778 RepID=UPI002027AF0C|nr:hypothetical protein [Caballeronia sp. ATUFL_M1_KS5A]